jgi:catechol 2,3-dioxygenase
MATRPAQAAAEGRQIDPQLRIGAVSLAVSDLGRSAEFYGHTLGLELVAEDGDVARLRAPHHDLPVLALHRLPHPVAASPEHTGLFHVAWLHPGRAQLAATAERLLRARWPIDGASDHGVSEALYLSDPDGLGIEIYADRPREQWPHTGDGREIAMFTAPLDLEDLLAQAPSELPDELPEAIRVGHVHLKVADVPRAAAFYRDVLGFSEQAHMPSAAFLAAGGYHHHVGLNSWQSRGATPAPPDAPGLREVTFALSGADALSQLHARVAQQAPQALVAGGAPGHLRARDPDDNALEFIVGYAV